MSGPAPSTSAYERSPAPGSPLAETEDARTEEDTWNTVAFQDGNEDLTVYDLAVMDGTVVAVGDTPSALHTAVCGMDDGTALVRELSGTAESGEVSLFVGLAVTD